MMFTVSTNSSFQFFEEKSLREHFGSEDIQNIDDIIHRSSSDTYVFDEDTLYISSNGQVTSRPLSNNGNSNVYKSNNYAERPLTITGACELDSDTHLFLSSDTVYTFTFGDKTWHNKGTLVC